MTPQQASGCPSRHPGPEEYIRSASRSASSRCSRSASTTSTSTAQLFIAILVGAAAAKFILVVLFFMHLKFDSRLFTTAFVTGMALALAVFTVVLATLGATSGVGCDRTRVSRGRQARTRCFPFST